MQQITSVITHMSARKLISSFKKLPTMDFTQKEMSVGSHPEFMTEVTLDIKNV